MGAPGKSKGGGAQAAPAPSPAPVAPPVEEPETRDSAELDEARRARAANKTEEDDLTQVVTTDKTKSKGKTLLGL